MTMPAATASSKSWHTYAMRSAHDTTSPSGVAGAGRLHEWLRMPSIVSAHRLRAVSVTSAPHTAWSKPSATYGDSASSDAWPPGPWPQSCPSAMASVSATLRPTAAATERATWATSSAWVRRVRWWSSGKTNTWVLPARRRKALECRMRSRSRSKQVRNGSGASSASRSPAPNAREACGASDSRSCSSRAARSAVARSPGPAQESAWASATPSSAAWPRMVDAHFAARSCIPGSVRVLAVSMAVNPTWGVWQRARRRRCQAGSRCNVAARWCWSGSPTAAIRTV